MRVRVRTLIWNIVIAQYFIHTLLLFKKKTNNFIGIISAFFGRNDIIGTLITIMG